jgi:hypothetical protein
MSVMRPVGAPAALTNGELRLHTACEAKLRSPCVRAGRELNGKPRGCGGRRR